MCGAEGGKSPWAQRVWHKAGKAFSSSPAPDVSQASLTTDLSSPACQNPVSVQHHTPSSGLLHLPQDLEWATA